jgi:hypothetical protein
LTDRGFRVESAKKAIASGSADGYFEPAFPDGVSGTDWNDYTVNMGIDKAAAEIQRRIEELTTEASKQFGRTFAGVRIYNDDDLREHVFPPVKWIAEGILPEGITNLFGLPKER